MYMSACNVLLPKKSTVTAYGFHYRHRNAQTGYVDQNQSSQNKKNAVPKHIRFVAGVKACPHFRC
jgi:hypothetical protein